jgi:hypothetical protein
MATAPRPVAGPAVGAAAAAGGSAGATRAAGGPAIEYACPGQLAGELLRAVLGPGEHQRPVAAARQRGAHPLTELLLPPSKITSEN